MAGRAGTEPGQPLQPDDALLQVEVVIHRQMVVVVIAEQTAEGTVRTQRCRLLLLLLLLLGCHQTVRQHGTGTVCQQGHPGEGGWLAVARLPVDQQRVGMVLLSVNDVLMFAAAIHADCRIAFLIHIC